MLLGSNRSTQRFGQLDGLHMRRGRTPGYHFSRLVSANWAPPTSRRRSAADGHDVDGAVLEAFSVAHLAELALLVSMRTRRDRPAAKARYELVDRSLLERAEIIMRGEDCTWMLAIQLAGNKTNCTRKESILLTRRPFAPTATRAPRRWRRAKWGATGTMMPSEGRRVGQGKRPALFQLWARGRFPTRTSSAPPRGGVEKRPRIRLRPASRQFMKANFEWPASGTVNYEPNPA
jgi:hypothetical protein